MKNMGILTDLRLLFATFGILFSADSTSGVDEGTLTAMNLKALKDWPENERDYPHED